MKDENIWLKWDEYYDDNDNTFWESRAISDEYGEIYFYRIVQKLIGNKILFFEASSPELWIDYRSPNREEWSTLEEAKRDMEGHFKGVLNEKI